MLLLLLLLLLLLQSSLVWVSRTGSSLIHSYSLIGPRGLPTAFPRLPRELWTGEKEKASQNQCNVVNMIDKKTSDYFCCSLTNTAVNPATVGRILMIFSADPYEISILMKWWKNISPLARLRLQKGDTVTPYKRNQSVLKDMSSCIFGKCKINHCY